MDPLWPPINLSISTIYAAACCEDGFMICQICSLRWLWLSLPLLRAVASMLQSGRLAVYLRSSQAKPLRVQVMPSWSLGKKICLNRVQLSVTGLKTCQNRRCLFESLLIFSPVHYTYKWPATAPRLRCPLCAYLPRRQQLMFVSTGTVAYLLQTSACISVYAAFSLTGSAVSILWPRRQLWKRRGVDTPCTNSSPDL